MAQVDKPWLLARCRAGRAVPTDWWSSAPWYWRGADSGPWFPTLRGPAKAEWCGDRRRLPEGEWRRRGAYAACGIGATVLTRFAGIRLSRPFFRAVVLGNRRALARRRGLRLS